MRSSVQTLFVLGLLSSLLTACPGSISLFGDMDGDGFEGKEDCLEGDAEVYPGAPELCDGIDNDCDGEVDEEVMGAFYTDADGDGFGDPDTEVFACSKPGGTVEVSGDCDDAEERTHPDAREPCDGVDNDCDGTIDGADSEGASTWFPDADGDGFGVEEGSFVGCEPGSGFAEQAGDCDDENAVVNPSAIERCDGDDDDCDGEIDEAGAEDAPSWYRDADEDGYGDALDVIEACEALEGRVSNADDCDDSSASIHPAAQEICDPASVDEDCDGLADDDDESALIDGKLLAWTDIDGDEFGDSASEGTLYCHIPSNMVENDLDCNDRASTVNPLATERCDGIDNNCDGLSDGADAENAGTWYQDLDGDGFGSTSSVVSCLAPEGTSGNDRDCDDTSASIHPGGQEICDPANLDEDCDGGADNRDPSADMATRTRFYPDLDGDGFGDASDEGELLCDLEGARSLDNTDCNDRSWIVFPGAEEVCNLVDDDCDGSADEDATNAYTWNRDVDGDGFGREGETKSACQKPDGYAANDVDCDDDDATIHPGGQEICDTDNRDEDCDGVSDNDDPTASADSKTLWYRDTDGDGYGSITANGALSCDEPAFSASTDNLDCNDLDEDFYPGAPETCDGHDNNCDGVVDESCVGEPEIPDRSGTFTGILELQVTVTTLGLTDTCEGVMVATVDVKATPQIRGSGTCTFDGSLAAFLGTQTGRIDGNMSTDPAAEGQVYVGSSITESWDGLFTDDRFVADFAGSTTLSGWPVTFLGGFELDRD